MAHDPDAPRPPDDDPLSGPIAAPDAPPDAAERARARGFGDLVDKVLAGRAPAAVPAEDRALLEVATAIRAATRPVELPPARVSSIVEGALAAAIDRRAGLPPGASPSSTVPIVPLASRRRGRVLPWAVAGATTLVAAAAVTLLVLQRAPVAAPPTAAASLPVQQRSRPADPLVGVIARDRAGDAADRLDVIYADRLDGFRERTLAPVRPRRAGGRP